MLDGSGAGDYDCAGGDDERGFGCGLVDGVVGDVIDGGAAGEDDAGGEDGAASDDGAFVDSGVASDEDIVFDDDGGGADGL